MLRKEQDCIYHFKQGVQMLVVEGTGPINRVGKEGVHGADIAIFRDCTLVENGVRCLRLMTKSGHLFLEAALIGNLLADPLLEHVQVLLLGLHLLQEIELRGGVLLTSGASIGHGKLVEDCA